MNVQALVVVLVVVGCCLQAAWVLMPAAARRWLAGRLATLPLPTGWKARLEKRARAASGCGCDGCDRSDVKARAKNPPAAGPAAQPITFHRRAQR